MTFLVNIESKIKLKFNHNPFSLTRPIGQGHGLSGYATIAERDNSDEIFSLHALKFF